MINRKKIVISTVILLFITGFSIAVIVNAGDNSGENTNASSDDIDVENNDESIIFQQLKYFCEKDKEDQIKEIRNILSKKMNHIGRKAVLALLKVEEIRKHFENSNYNPIILHWPDQTDDYYDPSHAGIFDIESDPDVIAIMIAQV